MVGRFVGERAALNLSVQKFRAPRLLMHPFLWLPSGVVSSLEDLSALGSAPAQSDVSFSVNGKDSGHHHLTVAELADGKIIGDLRLVATADDVVVGGLQSLFGCAEPRSHYLLHRRRLRMPKYRQRDRSACSAMQPAATITITGCWTVCRAGRCCRRRSGWIMTLSCWTGGPHGFKMKF